MLRFEVEYTQEFPGSKTRMELLFSEVRPWCENGSKEEHELCPKGDVAKITEELLTADSDFSGKISGPWREEPCRMMPDTSRRQVPQKDKSMGRRLGFRIQEPFTGRRLEATIDSMGRVREDSIPSSLGWLLYQVVGVPVSCHLGTAVQLLTLC